MTGDEFVVPNKLIGYVIKFVQTSDIRLNDYLETVLQRVDKCVEEFRAECQQKTQKEVLVVYDFSYFSKNENLMKVKLFGYES